jgi:sphinganine-1-phosphate aldolase
VAFNSDVFDIYRVCDLLKEKHWNLNMLQFPKSFHLCCVYLTDADTFCRDLEEAVTVVRQNPQEKCTGASAFYGQSASIPDRALVGRVAYGYIDTLYLPVDNKK